MQYRGIPVDQLPKAERASARSLDYTLGRLGSFVRDFEQCVHLLNCSRKYAALHREWSGIAARYGAILIFNVHEAIKSIRGTYLKSCPTLREKHDARSLRRAAKQLAAGFKEFEPLRHSVAHAGLAGHQEHHVHLHGSYDLGGATISGSPTEGEGMIVGTIIAGARVTTAWEGRMVSYDLDRSSSDKLIRVETLCYAAFKGAEALTSLASLPSPLDELRAKIVGLIQAYASKNEAA